MFQYGNAHTGSAKEVRSLLMNLMNKPKGRPTIIVLASLPILIGYNVFQFSPVRPVRLLKATNNTNDRTVGPQFRLEEVDAATYPAGSHVIESTASLCHSWDYSDQPHASCWYQGMCLQRPDGWNATLGDEKLQFLYVSDLNEEPKPFTLGVAENRRTQELNIQPQRISMEEFANISTNSSVLHVSGTSILWYEYIMSNFGHVLTDNLLPIFSLLDSMGTPTPDVTLYEFKASRPLGFNCEVQYEARWVRRDPKLLERTKNDCQRFGPMMFPMITNQPVSLLSSLFSGPQQDFNIVCFQNLLVGYPFLGLAHNHHLDPYKQDTMASRDAPKPAVHLGWHGRQSQLWRFRQYTMQNLGIADSSQIRNLVVIWNRNDQKRLLRDLTGFAAYLTQSLPNDVEIVVTEFEGMDLKQQIELISQAAVHITGPGGGSFIGVYLPRGSTQIRLYSADYLMEAPFFNSLGYIHVDHLGCSNNNITKGEAVLCGNSDSSGMSFSSLLDLVNSALHRRQRFGSRELVVNKTQH